MVTPALLDFGRAHRVGMADAVEADKPFSPVDVGSLGGKGEVFNARLLADLVEEFHRRAPERYIAHSHLMWLRPPRLRSVNVRMYIYQCQAKSCLCALRTPAARYHVWDCCRINGSAVKGQIMGSKRFATVMIVAALCCLLLTANPAIAQEAKPVGPASPVGPVGLGGKTSAADGLPLPIVLSLYSGGFLMVVITAAAIAQRRKKPGQGEGT